MNLNLKNKVIVVTGGAKGIGEAITLKLAQEGAIPVVIGRQEQDNKKVVERITSNNGVAHQIAGELTSNDECKRAVELTIQRFGRIDGLVNNAGVNDGVGLANGKLRSICSVFAQKSYSLLFNGTLCVARTD
jgi:L-fucose dehydrogenase